MEKLSRIKLRNARLGYHKTHEETEVLKGIDLDFFAGDFVGVVGLNGTGKSTLLKSICGLLPLLGGEIFLEEESIKNIRLTEIAKKVSIVLTERIGGFNLTAFDAVAAGQIPYTDAFHRLGEENIRIIDSAIEICGIKDHQHKLLHELSDGLFQKTMIARALAQLTPNILLDEPSAFLDYASKHELFLLLKKLSEEGKCILVSSHDLDLVLKYCHRLLLVTEGKVELIQASEASQHPSFLSIGRGFI
jgi:iron complex transport system ATP-binding protein